MFICGRCEIVFEEKKYLVQHLKRKIPCIEINILNKTREELLHELTKKESNVVCKSCNRKYKNEKSLKSHKCSAKTISGDIEELRKELKKQLNETKEVKETLKKLLDRPVSNNTTIHNTTNNNTINNNLNVTLNCFMDTSGKPIEYLLNSDNIKEKILNWIKSKKGLLEYIDEKFYNPEHPENMIIKKGDNGENIKLHISGKWKQLNNIKASDLILTNVGNDFMIYMDTIKDTKEDYKTNKKIIKKFENEVMKPLDWGIDVSEDSSNPITKTIVKNEVGEYVYLEDELENDKKLQMTKNVINHIHSKDIIDI